jgi:hypothetical protein
MLAVVVALVVAELKELAALVAVVTDLPHLEVLTLVEQEPKIQAAEAEAEMHQVVLVVQA